MSMTSQNRDRAPGLLLSHLVMGGTQIRQGHLAKGLAFLVLQIAFILSLPALYASLAGLTTLGTQAQKTSGFDVIQGDNSIHLLVEGVGIVMLLLVLAGFYLINLRDAHRLAPTRQGFGAQIKAIYENRFAFLMLVPAAFIALTFIILPIVITVAVSFTNYSAPNHIPPKNLVDWVGLETYFALFRMKIWSSTFVGVAIWTFIWAICATAATVSVGFLLALALSKKNIRFKGVWRLIFILPYAIPVFVTLLAFRVLLNGVGPVNAMLGDWGIAAIPFLTDPTMAKVTCILLTMWAGAPYFMLMISGALTNIPSDIYEASEVDGAGKFRQFSEITFPMVMAQIAPSLVMTFAYNFNNFGAVYLLTEGGPINPDYRFAGHTDLLITWIYKLTLDFQQYHIASVVSIIIFLFLSTMAIWQFRRMKSFKEEVGG